MATATAGDFYIPRVGDFSTVRARFHASSEALTGAIGGPLVVAALTPQRNAMTLAAKDPHSSFMGLYRQVFAEGFFKGYRGGSRPVMVAAPQFTAIGPLYLYTERLTGSPTVALFAAALTESLGTFTAHRRNAQVQFNATRTNPAERLVHQPIYKLMGPGFVPHVARNMFAMMGIRLISPYSYEIVRHVPGSQQLSEEGRLVAADFTASVAAAMLSMPPNHLFSWMSCTPELDNMGYLQRGRAALAWQIGTYREQGMGLLARDFMIRISYTAFLFTAYRFVERNLIALGNEA